MIDCAQCRRTVLADPHAASPELEEHLAHCPECPAYRERLLPLGVLKQDDQLMTHLSPNIT